eukprot:6926680-Pyramimonas_sp.AAC.1
MWFAGRATQMSSSARSERGVGSTLDRAQQHPACIRALTSTGRAATTSRAELDRNRINPPPVLAAAPAALRVAVFDGDNLT